MVTKRTLIVAVALAVLACTLAWAAETKDPISQGDFAVLLASNLKAAPPAGGWTPATATAFLKDMGLAPIGGAWNPTEPLKEGNLVNILREMGQPYYSVEPDTIVTWGQAYTVMARFADFFRTYPAVARTGSNDPTTHIYTGMGSTAAGGVAPASPSRP
jgi:hypothetical protein